MVTLSSCQEQCSLVELIHLSGIELCSCEKLHCGQLEQLSENVHNAVSWSSCPHEVGWKSDQKSFYKNPLQYALKQIAFGYPAAKKYNRFRLQKEGKLSFPDGFARTTIAGRVWTMATRQEDDPCRRREAFVTPIRWLSVLSFLIPHLLSPLVVSCQLLDHSSCPSQQRTPHSIKGILKLFLQQQKIEVRAHSWIIWSNFKHLFTRRPLLFLSWSKAL